METDFLFWWRAGNTIIASSALIYLALDFRVIRQELNSRRLYLTFSLAGLLSAVVFGSVNGIIFEIALSPAMPVITASCLWCLIGLFISRNEHPPIWKDFPK